MKNLLKWLFTKQQGDEDPIVLEDTDHPLTDAEIKELDNNQTAQSILKNISSTPKLEKPEVAKAEVIIAVVKPVDEIKVDVVIPEPPKPTPPPPPVPVKNFNDGFTSTGSIYGKLR